MKISYKSSLQNGKPPNWNIEETSQNLISQFLYTTSLKQGSNGYLWADSTNSQTQEPTFKQKCSRSANSWK